MGFVRTSEMGSKRPFSSSSELEASSFLEDKRGKKLKGVAGGCPDSGGGPDEKVISVRVCSVNASVWAEGGCSVSC